jgi:hypothetical protein
VKGAGVMSKIWSGLLWILVLVVIIGYIVLWRLPTPEPEGTATLEERAQAVEQVKQVDGHLPEGMRLDKVKAHPRMVVEVNVTYTDRASAPDVQNRDAWEALADEVAVLIAKEYLPEGWQVNVAMWYKKSPLSSSLPYGLAGRAAGDNPEGGPARLVK